MRHILSSGLVAGLAAGLLCALLQYLLVEPKILLAERYESGEITHFQGHADGHTDHAAMEAKTGQGAATGDEAAAPADAHQHHGGGAEMTPVKRQALTVLFAVLTYAGYGLLLTGGMALTTQSGIAIRPAEGILWGIAGFLAFQLLPALGLEPELPGTPAADLAARQAWWVMVALASVAGLGFIAYGKAWALRLAGLGLIVLPHLFGAPRLDGFGGVVPPELAASFATRSLGIGLFVWGALGWLVQRLWTAEPA